MIQITSTNTLKDAARIHVRYFHVEGRTHEVAYSLRDQIIDRINPQWPNDIFWAEVDNVCEAEGIDCDR